LLTYLEADLAYYF